MFYEFIYSIFIIEAIINLFYNLNFNKFKKQICITKLNKLV